MTETLKAWECIGCGRLESSQPCIGVCRDRPVELVYAAEHARVLEQLTQAEHRAAALEAIVRHLAWTSPRPGRCDETLTALRGRARELLASLGSAAGAHPP
jgi:hypothetical protein